MAKRLKKKRKAGRFYIYKMKPDKIHPKGSYEIWDEALECLVYIGDDLELAKQALMSISRESRSKKDRRNPIVQIYEMENGSREIPDKKLKKMAIRAYDNNLKVIEKLDEWGLL